MRILFTFVGGSGHFEPLVALARASVAAGHTVAFANRPGMTASVEKAGFSSFAIGLDYGDSDKRYPLAEVDMAQEYRVVREFFVVRQARERCAAILALCAEWKPDLIVCDEMDFGAMIAAEKLGLPHASVSVIAAGGFAERAQAADALDAVRAEFGLPSDPEMQMLSRYLVLSPFPRGYRDPAFPLPATAHFLRLVMPDYTAKLPVSFPNDAPLVYFTLGTVFDRESGDLFTRVITGLHDLPINLLVTVGKFIDPAEFGEQPPNVRIERYIPQAEILPHCALVVSHGGSGSVIGSLTHGLPSVLLPMGADQPLNGERYAALGLGLTLNPMQVTPESIRAAAATVLADRRYRQAAEKLRDEIAAMPDAGPTVPLLEQLVTQKQV